MQASVTVHMAAPADKIWDVVADVRNTPKFSPEVFESEWLDGATGPALGCDVPRAREAQRDRPGLLDDVPGDRRANRARDFGFEVLMGDRPVNNWHYAFSPAGDGTDVTESFRMTEGVSTKLFGDVRRTAA